MWKGAIYPRMRLKGLFVFLVSFAPPTPTSPLALKGCRSREGEEKGKRADMIMVRVVGCQRFTLLACSLAKKIKIWLQHEKYRMSAISCHDIGDSIYFFIIMQRLSGFLNCRLSPTNASQQHQRLTKTHLAVRERKHICLFPFCFDSVSANSSSGLAVKGWKLL